MLRHAPHAVALIAVLGLPAMALQTQSKKPDSQAPPCPDEKVFVLPFEGYKSAIPNLESYGLGYAGPLAVGPLSSYFEQDSNAGFMGVMLGTVSDAKAKELGLDKALGVYVEHVVADGPAARAGLHDGDVIVSIDGKPIQSAEAFREILDGLKPDQAVRVEILRDKKRQAFSVTLGSRPKMPEFFQRGWLGKTNPDASYRWGFGNRARLGVSLVDLSDQLREHFGVDEGKGVLVSSVEAGSAAAKAGIKAGDVIVSLGTVDVASAFDVVKELQKLQEGTTSISVGVVRDRSRQAIDVTIVVPEKRELPEVGHYRT